MTPKPQHENLSMAIRVTLLALLILTVVVVLWYLLYYNPLIARILELTGLSEEKSTASFRFTGEAYALAGDKLAVASPVGAQLMDSSGVLHAAESFPMDNPALSASAVLSVYYDVGGTAFCVIMADGEVVLLPQDYRILSADVSRDGYVTVVTEYPDYKGRVQVLSPGLTPLFLLDCGSSGYPLCARVSPRRHLAVCCVSSLGSTLRFFSLDSENELATLTLENTLVLDFNYLEDGSMVAVTEDSLLFLSEDGTLLECVEFDVGYPVDYCLTGDCAAVLLRTEHSGSLGRLCTYAGSGELRGSIAVERDVLSLSVREGQILVLYADEMTLYPTDFSDSISYQRISNGHQALLCGKNRAMLLGTYGAEVIRFP